MSDKTIITSAQLLECLAQQEVEKYLPAWIDYVNKRVKEEGEKARAQDKKRETIVFHAKDFTPMLTDAGCIALKKKIHEAGHVVNLYDADTTRVAIQFSIHIAPACSPTTSKKTIITPAQLREYVAKQEEAQELEEHLPGWIDHVNERIQRCALDAKSIGKPQDTVIFHRAHFMPAPTDYGFAAIIQKIRESGQTVETPGHESRWIGVTFTL